jgi:hypothetical protein
MYRIMLLSEETSFIQGVHQTPIVAQQERTDDLNIRLRSRQFPDFALEPQYDFRPVSTKYQVLGASNSPVFQTPAPKQTYMEHNVEMNFNPATRNGPWKTYARNIDTETVLRNYAFGVDASRRLPNKIAIDTMYVPESNSDLYKDGATVVERPSEQPYELLFARPSFDGAHSRWNAQSKIGADRFNNSTRTQLKQAL